MSNADIVRRFENEFKNRENLDIVDELMSDDFVHHAPFPGLPPGRAGLKVVGQVVFGAIANIVVTIDHLIAEGDLVADRVSATGIRKDTGARVNWTENHFYAVRNGKIVEWWPEGGPPLQ